MVIGKDSSDGLRLARVYWIGLGRPPRLDSKKVMDNWAPRMETLMRKAGMAYDDFKWYLIWSTRLRDQDGANYGNDFTAQYLRNARDPMNILEKHFMDVFFNIFMESASKKLPYLKDVVQRERDLMLRDYAPPQRTLTYLDIIPKHPVWSEAWRREYARWLTAVDKRFSMLEPAPGEDMEDFVDRKFLPVSDNRDWRCSQCTYNPSRTGVRNSQETDDPMVQDVVYYGKEERLKWCGDCWEEYLACRDEDIIIHAQDNAPFTLTLFMDGMTEPTA
jgi:hypothetical protein